MPTTLSFVHNFKFITLESCRTRAEVHPKPTHGDVPVGLSETVPDFTNAIQMHYEPEVAHSIIGVG